MQYNDFESKEVKQEEINEILSDFFSKEEEIESIREHFFTDYCIITPPIKEQYIQFFHLKSSTGEGGAKTIKPGNILLNLKSLFYDALEGGVAIFTTLENKYLLALSVLFIARKILNTRSLTISERHSITLVTLWDLRNQTNDIVLGQGLLEKVNHKFLALDKPILTQTEFDNILTDLSNLKSIRLNSDGTISLLEQIRGLY